MLKESLIRKTYLIGVIFEVICFLNQVGSFGVTSQEDASMMNWIDSSVDPCDNFYQFACGNYYKYRRDITFMDNFILLRGLFEEKLLDIVENDEFTEKDPRAFRLMKSFYNTCMDAGSADKGNKSDNEFLNILKNLGGWPVLVGNSWNEVTFQWNKLDSKLHNMGFHLNSFFTFHQNVDWRNASRRILYLDQPILGLQREILLLGAKEEIVRAYFKFMVDVAEIFGADRKKAQEELSDSIFFEIQLAKIMSSQEDRIRNEFKSPFNFMSLKELQIKFPNLNWKNYINEMLAPHLQIDFSENIVVIEKSYVKSFFDLISKTPKRVLANYLFWRVVKNSASSLGEQVREAEREFSNILAGRKISKPKWKECMTQLYYNFGTALGAAYTRRHFDNDTRKNVVGIVNNIKNVFRSHLIKADWLDRGTKMVALDKLDCTIPRIGFPCEYYDNKKLDDYYKNLELHPESYLMSQLRLNQFIFALEVQKLRRPFNRTEWINYEYSLDVTLNAPAYHQVMDNTIGITAVILQELFYSRDMPQYQIYGTIGQIIGHELSHAIHGKGAMFDKKGTMSDWWGPESKQKFHARTSCLNHQSNNPISKHELGSSDGNVYLEENICDNIGIKLAYLTYNFLWRQKWVGPKATSTSWFGSKFSFKQMFWISVASVHCSKYKLESGNATEYHNPSEHRVNGALSNIPLFSKDFNCSLNTKMNPDKKCFVW